MNLDALVAIDFHVHAERGCQPVDPAQAEFEQAASA
jgi:hypothetical protein